MPLDSRKVSEKIHEGSLGSLRGCLVEGNPEQRRRERRLRRRALVLSITIQTAVLALLTLLSLFGRTGRIALAINTPIPPYGHPLRHSEGVTTHATGHASMGRFVFAPPTARRVPPSNEADRPAGPPEIGAGAAGTASGPECSWCIDIGGKNTGPAPPQPVVATPQKPRLVHQTTIDPAMLIHRVEPIYPPLATQVHKEGRVELHARIATDGSIQSLEVAGGDPMFFQSALEAVRQWRYRPTILNGQPVEIDTHITVIYTMPH
jgi:protein TonB